MFQKKQYKIVCQSQWIMKIANQSILQYVNCLGNHLMIYSRHIDYNRNINNYDRNSTAYSSYVTADSHFTLIFTKDPHSIHIFDNKTGRIMVARGLDELIQARIICVAVQPQEEVKQSSHTRKINLLYEHKGNIYFQVIQIEPNIDNNPKHRIKTIQQSTHLQNLSSKVDPIFSCMIWNYFILCKKKQSIRVCRAIKKNQQLSLNFSLQAVQPSLNSLFSNLNVLGMTESLQTWAILCGNNNNARNDQRMTINIFWQNFQGNELTKFMYYKDSSFIKNIELPSTQKNFVKFWFYNGCYLIQTNSSYDGHQVHIVPQKVQANLVTLKLIASSQLCRYSLNINNTEVSVCQVVNKMELFKTKLYEKQVTNQQNSTANTAISTNNTANITQRNTSNSIEDKNKMAGIPKKEIQPSIKLFATINEKEGTNKQLLQITKPQNKQQVKNTVKKFDNPFNSEKKSQPPKPIISQKIATHFNKNDKAEKTQTYSITSEEIEAPDSLKNLVSFGIASQIKPKTVPAGSNISFGTPNQLSTNTIVDKKQVAPPSIAAISFGNPNIKQTKTPGASIPDENQIQKNKQKMTINVRQPKQQKKSIPTVSKIHAKEIIQIVKNLVTKIDYQLQLRSNQFNNNYKSLPIQRIKLQPLLNKSQANIVTNSQILVSNCELVLKNKKKQLETKNNLNINLNKQKIRQKIEKYQLLLNKLQITTLTETLQFKNLKKFTKKKNNQKSIQSNLLRNIEQMKDQFQQIDTKISCRYQSLKRQLIELKLKKQKEKKKLNLKAFTQGLKNLKPLEQKIQWNMKIPMLRRKYIQDEIGTPFLKLEPLKET